MTMAAVDATPGIYLMSPTQFNSWEDCNRQWAFRYILGLRREADDSSQCGSDVHKLLEDYHNTGVKWEYPTNDEYRLKVAQIAEQALPHRPPPMVGFAERTFSLGLPWVAPTISKRKIHWNGVRDLVCPPGTWQPWLVIGDYKTTSDLKWAKTERELLTDPQAMAYAAVSMHEYLVDEVELRWIYLRRTKPYTSQVTKVKVKWEHAKKEFHRLNVVAESIERAHDRSAVVTVEDVKRTFEPTLTSCNKYRGCPYRSECNHSPAELRKALFSGTSLQVGNMSNAVIEAIKAKQAAERASVQGAVTSAFSPPVPGPVAQVAGVNTPSVPVDPQHVPTPAVSGAVHTPPVVAPVPQPPALPPPVTTLEALEANKHLYPADLYEQAKNLLARLAPPVAKLAITATVEPAAPAATTGLEVIQRTHAAMSTNPVVHQTNVVQPPQTTAEGIVPKPSTESYGPVNPPETAVAAKEDHTVVPQGVVAQGEVVVKPTRKRRTKAEIEADKLREEADRQACDLGDTNAARVLLEKAEALEATGHGLLTVYINCWPSWPVATADTFIAQAKAQINEARSTPEKPIYDYRQIPYGEGTGMLSVITAQLVKASGVKEISVFTSTPEGSAVAAGLVELAGGRAVRA